MVLGELLVCHKSTWLECFFVWHSNATNAMHSSRISMRPVETSFFFDFVLILVGMGELIHIRLNKVQVYGKRIP